MSTVRILKIYHQRYDTLKKYTEKKIFAKGTSHEELLSKIYELLKLMKSSKNMQNILRHLIKGDILIVNTNMKRCST